MSSQSQRILKQAELARKRRDSYAQDELAQLQKALKQSHEDLTKAIRKLPDVNNQSANQALRFARLNAIKKQVDQISGQLEKSLLSAIEKQVEGAVQLGIVDGIQDLSISVPRIADLSAKDQRKLTVSVFTQLDHIAIDFLVRYRIELLGDVSAQLSRSIKLHISSGIINGTSTPDIVGSLGKVIKDPGAFRQAGKTVFKSAQQRLETIARSETNRAHNQGRIKFYETEGVEKVRWFADDDPCPVCAGLDGTIYSVHKLPSLPAHPKCECTVVAAI